MPQGMHRDHDLFAPAMPGGRKRAITLAVLAHLVLIGALTWGVHWKTSSDQPAVEAELWSAAAQQAAPRAVAPPPPPPAPPEPAPQPVPAPAPPPPRQAEPAQPSEADIALEREKKRQQEEKKRMAQLEQQKQEKLEKERHEQEEAKKKQALVAQQQKEKAEREKAEKEKAAKAAAEKEKAAKAAEQEKQRKLAEEKRKAEAAQAQRAEELRQEQLKRIAGLAGATGGETATGNAQRSSGPSGSYAGKVSAKVKPNIVYPDTLPGNPRAEVEVRAAPDGTIVGVRLTKSSGNAAWDDAVVRALYKTETLPRDVDGRVPSSLAIGFRPKD